MGVGGRFKRRAAGSGNATDMEPSSIEGRPTASSRAVPPTIYMAVSHFEASGESLRWAEHVEGSACEMWAAHGFRPSRSRSSRQSRQGSGFSSYLLVEYPDEDE